MSVFIANVLAIRESGWTTHLTTASLIALTVAFATFLLERVTAEKVSHATPFSPDSNRFFYRRCV